MNSSIARFYVPVGLAWAGLSACCFTPTGESQPVLDAGGDDAGPPTFCTIDGLNYADGMSNPLNACQVCRLPESTGWTNLEPGTACAAGRRCSRGACLATCAIGGGEYLSGSSDPADHALCCNPNRASTQWSPRFVDGGAFDPPGSGFNSLAAARIGSFPVLAAATTNGVLYLLSELSGQPSLRSEPTSTTTTYVLAGGRLGVPGHDEVVAVDGYALKLVSPTDGTEVVIFDMGGVADGFFGAAIDDFDGDGIPDLVTMDALGQGPPNSFLRFFKGDIAGHLAPPVTSQMPYSLGFAQGHFRDPSTLDVALVGAEAIMTIATNDGRGQFTSTASYQLSSSGEWDVVGDFNGDGIQDVAVPAGRPTGGISVFYGTGDGGFGRAQLYPGSGDSSGIPLASGDLDGDGRSDLVEGLWFADSGLDIFWQLADGGLSPPQHIPSTTFIDTVIVADLNSDGALDIAAQSHDGASPSLFVLLNGCP